MRLTSTTGFRAAVGAASAALLVVLATPTPAFANNIMISATAVNVGESPGSSTVTVRNADVGKAPKVRISVAASGEAAGYVDVEIGGGCKAANGVADCGKIEPMGTKTFTVTVKQKADGGLKQGESKTGNIDFKIETPHTGAPASAPLTVTGFAQVATSIGGKITDLKTGKGVEGASITVNEDGGAELGKATTDKDGAFSISAEVQPETSLKWKVTKKGFEDKSDTYTVPAAGQAVSIEVRLKKKESDKAESTQAPEEENGSGGPDEGGFTAVTWVLIVLGILLAIGGIIAIWMLLRKGKEEDDDEEKLPDEPLTHQLSASQTGKFGVYEASGVRPGADNPTMLHSGGLISDDDLARYGSDPGAAAGFGPAYGDAQATRAMNAPGDVPPAATTQRYAAGEPGPGGYQSNEPVSGSTQRYPAAEPASGTWRSNEPVSGGYQSNEPVSGAWQSNQAVSGGYQSNQPVSGADQRYPAEPAAGSWRSQEPASGSWQSNQPTSGSTQRYPSADPASGGGYPSGDSYGDRGAQYDDRGSGGQHYRESDSYGGYGDQQPRQSSGRRYRDDDYGDYDDRPRSW